MQGSSDTKTRNSKTRNSVPPRLVSRFRCHHTRLLGSLANERNGRNHPPRKFISQHSRRTLRSEIPGDETNARFTVPNPAWFQSSALRAVGASTSAPWKPHGFFGVETDRQTDRQIGRQTDRHTKTKTETSFGVSSSGFRMRRILYRGTSLIGNSPPLEPYGSPRS
jgi:hypothetical protein